MQKVRVLGHSPHPMLVVFPLGLLATSVAWDICYLATKHPMWGAVAFWTIIAGLIGGALAAITGLVDWLAIPSGTRAKRVGLLHAGLNVAIVVLFLISAIARAKVGYATPLVWQMILGWIAVAIALPSGWLGGELVERLGIGVEEGAHPDAPSSLRERHATGVLPTTSTIRGPREPEPV